MWQAVLREARLYELLTRIDAELAAEAQAEGCSCGGPLHQASYARKPRGGPPDLDRAFERRASFCCAERECRRRKTPASVRFLGRRVYLGVVVLLATALEGGLTRRRVATLRERVGVTERTLRRWQVWWREAFAETSFWRVARTRFLPPIEVGALPLSLVDRFVGADAVERAARVLRFLAPLSVRAL